MITRSRNCQMKIYDVKYGANKWKDSYIQNIHISFITIMHMLLPYLDKKIVLFNHSSNKKIARNLEPKFYIC